MNEQTDVTPSWMGAWAASVPAFMKAMIPTAQEAPNGAGVKSLVEEQFAALHATWKESIEKWTALAKENTRFEVLTPEALKAMFTPARWSGAGVDAFDSGLREILEGPKYATLWNTDREVLQLQQRAVERTKHARAYQALVQKAWNKVFERFSSSFSKLDETPSTWRGLTDRWLAIADEVFVEAHRSDEFVEAQSRLLRSASEYRLQERKLAEAWCAASHIPTRTEMDEMQRVVTELRRELRLQRRQAGGLPIPTSGPAAPTSRADRAPAPKRRSAATKTTHRPSKA